MPTADLCGVAAGGYDYTVSDGALTDTGHVTVNITCVNDAPIAGDDTVIATEDTDLDTPTADLLLNDTDVDSPSLKVTAVSNASGGTAVLLDNGTPLITSDDLVRFTPDGDLCGPAAGGYDYTASDGALTDTAHVTVNIDCVNDAPVAGDDTVTATEDTDLDTSTASLLSNDSDIDGDSLFVSAVANAIGGTAVLNDNGTPLVMSDDFVRFDPDFDLCGAGAGSYDYTVSDGSQTDTGHVTIDIICVNDAPVAGHDTVTATEDTDLDTPIADLLLNDSDVDSATLTVTAVSGATGGTATLMNNGTPANTADDFVRFVPTANLCGVAAGGYDYTVSDGALTDTGHVTVNITCVNDAPIAGDDTVIATEDTDLDTPTADLLLNDTDVDSPSLKVTAVSNASGGTAAPPGQRHATHHQR